MTSSLRLAAGAAALGYVLASFEDQAPRFALLVHHTDAEREWAYDRDSHIGKLDKALDEAKARGWTVVDMKADGRTICRH